jgi:hypothetical protein
LEPERPSEKSFRDEVSSTHSFILKFWLEEVEAENEKEVWRGRITHVPGNEQRHVKNIHEVIDFIETYLHLPAGARSDGGITGWLRSQLKQWICE